MATKAGLGQSISLLWRCLPALTTCLPELGPGHPGQWAENAAAASSEYCQPLRFVSDGLACAELEDVKDLPRRDSARSQDGSRRSLGLPHAETGVTAEGLVEAGGTMDGDIPVSSGTAHVVCRQIGPSPASLQCGNVVEAICVRAHRQLYAPIAYMAACLHCCWNHASWSCHSGSNGCASAKPDHL